MSRLRNRDTKSRSRDHDIYNYSIKIQFLKTKH